jgi:hypothetical protein
MMRYITSLYPILKIVIGDHEFIMTEHNLQAIFVFLLNIIFNSLFGLAQYIIFIIWLGKLLLSVYMSFTLKLHFRLNVCLMQVGIP